MKAERLEDLGRIRELLSMLINDYSFLFEKCASKHTIDRFIEEYKDEEKLEELHNKISRLEDRLNEIHYIAIGENYD